MNTSERKKRIYYLLPREIGYRRYSRNTVANCVEIITLIKNEPNKQMQFEYFKALIDKLFMQSPSFFLGVTTDSHTQMLKEQTQEIRSMLRKLKRLHFDIGYTPGCMSKINALIKYYGGTSMTVEQMRQKRKESFTEAVNRVKTGQKMPRKTKKRIKRILGVNQNQR